MTKSETKSMNKTSLISLLFLIPFLQVNIYGDQSRGDCTSKISNASYTGPYKGAENNLTTDDLLRDLNCAEKFIKHKFPKKFLTIFGSSRIGESNSSGDDAIDQANDKIYSDIYKLAYKWTKNNSKMYPILTGAGPGLMEAASRGATDAGGPSIGYTTYYGPSRAVKGGDPSKAFWKYRPSKGSVQNITSDGLIFTSVSIREYIMIMHSAAMIITPGGTGTEWEIFQTIEQIKSGQLKPVPIYIVGIKKLHWLSFYNRLDDMVKRGTIKRLEVEELITHVENPADVYELLSKDLLIH